MTPEAEAVLQKVLCLRKLSHDSNVQTRRSQGKLLQTLADDQMTEVSVALAQHQEKEGW